MSFDTDGFYKEVAFLVATARKRAGLRQEELADRAGITRSRLANIETGRQKSSVDTMWRLAFALGANVAELLPEPERTPRPADGAASNATARVATSDRLTLLDSAMVLSGTDGPTKG